VAIMSHREQRASRKEVRNEERAAPALPGAPIRRTDDIWPSATSPEPHASTVWVASAVPCWAGHRDIRRLQLDRLGVECPKRSQESRVS
jgi:hypothetical protein